MLHPLSTPTELSLTPNYGNQLGGQSVSVEILNDDDINLLAFNITCTFDNIEASVYPISSTTILAIMPSLNRAGYIPINVQFQEGPIIWSFTEDFYSGKNGKYVLFSFCYLPNINNKHIHS